MLFTDETCWKIKFLPRGSDHASIFSRLAANWKLAGSEGPHARGGRRLFCRCAAGRRGRGGISPSGGYGVRVAPTGPDRVPFAPSKLARAMRCDWSWTQMQKSLYLVQRERLPSSGCSRRGAHRTGDGLDPVPGLAVAILLPSITEDLLPRRRRHVTSLLRAMLWPAIVRRFADPLLRATAHHRAIIDKKARHL